MAPGARHKFGVPMFEPDVFRKQIYCIEESTCDIVGTIRRPPQVLGAHCSGIAPPCPLRYALGLIVQNRQAVQSTRRSLNWTLEDNMVDGLFVCATLIGRRRSHIPFVQAGAETSDTRAEAVNPDPVRP